ncbi:MAG TPA: flagellin lysine-N-methylase [Terriglobales bacterium]|nr:flagellin lysine-N-methylase [Terriglobales bacterium]
MKTTDLILPSYTEAFRCIGTACEDTCCSGWLVPIDRGTHEKFQALPAGPLRTLINANIQITVESEGRSKPPTFATLRMTGNHQCPLLSEDRLCRIQAEYGETFLPPTCASYPRTSHRIGGIEEKVLMLSCPEAARLVLLNPDLLSPVHPAITEPVCSEIAGDATEQSRSPQAWFWSIRKCVLAVVRNRAYPIWQRLFLLGLLCGQLDAIANGELDCPIPAYLHEFEAIVLVGSLRAGMDALPADCALQLDVVLRLAGMLLTKCNASPRFFDCVHAFTAGIGNGPGATLESLTARYTQAHDQFYAPFFDRHPYILENYLINTIFRCQYPFGRGGTSPSSRPSLAREHALLTGQFALMRGLLIGVAGFHAEAFCANHVVFTVQSASKHFEHHPDFLNQVYDLLAESRMEGDRGRAILLRHTEPPGLASQTGVTGLIARWEREPKTKATCPP